MRTGWGWLTAQGLWGSSSAETPRSGAQSSVCRLGVDSGSQG